jgi:uncharacterized protein
MTITIFGATGMVGQQLINVALSKGFVVKAFGRNVESLIDKDLASKKFIAIKGYVFDASDVLNAIKGSDAIISCLGGSIDGNDKTRSLGIKNIITQMQKSNCTRIIAIGGVGVLQANETTLMLDTPNYPQEFKAVAAEHLLAFTMLEKSNLSFTFVCPSTIKNKEATSSFTTAANYLPTINNESITSGDLSNFMIEALEHNKFINQRVGISN